jgi:hypothetical protein
MLWEPQPVELQIHGRIAQSVATGVNQLLPPEFRMSPKGYLWWNSRSDWPVGGFTRFSPLLNDSAQVEVKRVEEPVKIDLKGSQAAVTAILSFPWPPVGGGRACRAEHLYLVLLSGGR